ncbi:MAG: TAXI family TRAP transporter solute-binding subunit [Hyphomicrobiales bacterium]|nr:TAXI family TRAP transporter solute-binding subunit [Hyphomicrobiales bacterium]
MTQLTVVSRLLVGAAIIFTLTTAPPVQAQQGEPALSTKWEKAKRDRNRSSVTVISGGIRGTYIRFATDLANVLDDLKGNEMRVLPIAGRGGGQNVLDVLFLKGIDMGITQQDHLTFFKQKDPVLFGNIDKRIRYITKLYNAEFTMVARKEIKSFEDLKGKTVNLWRPWSATDIGGQTILKLLGLDKDVKIVHIDTGSGLEKVKSGEIAGTVLLAGAPIGGFKDLQASEGLHFVPLDAQSLPNRDFSKLLEVYLPTRLKHEDYPGMIPAGQSVPTVASGAVLAVYNWPENTERYRKVAGFVKRFFDNFEKFRQEPRHPKWKEINLAAKIPGWTRFKAAEEWLAVKRQPPAAGADAGDMRVAFDRFVKRYARISGGGQLSSRERDQLFRQFYQMWQSRNQ